MAQALFAAGCFWCIEAVFSQLKGVEAAISGYSDGDVVDPTYEQVCAGETQHAEVVQITFDPEVIQYTDLLHILFALHDPTSVDQRHGSDTPSKQYSSAVYYTDETQKAQALATIAELAPHYDRPIVTALKPAVTFYPAEEYHQGYFMKNPEAGGYCQAVVAPKFVKAKAKFAEFWRDA
ncbi:MAG: peptide-methionine (S)-S-oxide reductase MsrA [Neisseriaceae bacterium]|nr:peptide-methionine (S)-S-oxide reductase MsrA [Neisseriaceae bacterium]MBP6863343.1 peptide-methionine (S)-S-oxide reductase MsrA [Neisseriaceae bacterium]